MLMLMMALVAFVNANDGDLASFTADIDFNVADTVAAIAM